MGRINMRSRIFKITLITVMFILAAFAPLLIMDETEGIGTRASTPVKGHVTSDDTWDYHDLENVVIDAGVTVTVPAGGQIWLHEDGFFYVEGTLIVDGTKGNVAEFAILGLSGTYDGIVVNATGKVIIRNATIGSAHQGVVLGGLPSLIENTEIGSGDEGIAVTSSGNRIESCFIHHQNIAGIQFRTSTGPNYINDTEIDVIGGVGLGLDTTTGVYTQNLDIGDTDYGLEIKDSSNLNFINTTLMPSALTFSTAYGLLCDGLISDVNFDGLTIGNYWVIVDFNTDPGSEIFLNDVAIVPDNMDGVVAGSESSIHAIFMNSSINVDSDAAYAPSPGVLIDFINTSIEYGDINIENNGKVNTSWLLDLNVIDGNGDPLDCHVDVWNGSNSVYSADLPTGMDEVIPMVSVVWLYGMNNGEKVGTNLEFTSNEGSMTHYVTEEDWFHQNEEWIIMMDLWPTNNLSAVLEVDEDEWLNLDLNDNFTDPEGQDLYFEFMASPDLQVNQIGGHGSGTIKVRGAEDNWFGDGWLYVNATDPSGNMTEANVTVTVLSVNDRPFLTDPPLPELEVEEDSSVYINFTGMADDVESDVTWAADDVDNCVLAWDGSHINLTITPDENWFGMLEIPLNISDGDDWLHETLFINVTPVNDMPEIAFMWPNGTEVEMVEYAWNETVNITVYEITTLEDVSVDFWINATDIETMELTYYFDEEALLHGSVEVETFEYLNETNVTVTEIVPMNFSYTPDLDDFAGDLVMFNVSDGEADLGFWVWFNVAGVNDRPTFDAPEGWNVTVELDNLTVIDIADMIGDVDGDDLTVTVDSDYVTVNGTQLEILYNDTFDADWQNVTVTVSDGTLGATALIVISIDRAAVADDDDDDDDDEPVIGTLEVTPEEDGWLFEVTGDEGQTLFVVIEDEDGELTSYPMTYADGKYSVVVDAEDAEAGLSYHLSDVEDGESIGADNVGTLTDLAEADEDDPFPLWILLLIAVVVIIAIILIAVAMSRGKGADEYDEE